MKTFGFIGGDLRNIRLVEALLKDNNNIYTYGMENYKFADEIRVCSNMVECIKRAEFVIGAIPLSKDGKRVNSQYTSKDIEIKELFFNLKNKKFICGAINQEINTLAKENSIEIFDVMKDEELTALNVIPTVEGAIQVAMENTEITIHNSNILILGYGRIGKLLSKTLSNFGANVSCEARKEEDFMLIKKHGYKCIKLENLLDNLKKEKYDIIFNTIPHLILDKEKLLKIDKYTLIIDLASKPGGIDFEGAKMLELKTIWALALPGKAAPQTSAEYIKQVIYKITNKKEK